MLKRFWDLDDLPYRCPKCGSSSGNFKTLQALRQHLQDVHTTALQAGSSIARQRSSSPLTVFLKEEAQQLQEQVEQAKEVERQHREHWRDLEMEKDPVALADELYSTRRHQARLSNVLSSASEQLGSLQESTKQIVEEQFNTIGTLREHLKQKDQEVQHARQELQNLGKKKEELAQHLLGVNHENQQNQATHEHLQAKIKKQQQLVLQKQQEVGKLSDFLQQTSEKETVARQNLEEFIGGLLNRVENAEKQLHSGMEGTGPEGNQSFLPNYHAYMAESPRRIEEHDHTIMSDLLGQQHGSSVQRPSITCDNRSYSDTSLHRRVSALTGQQKASHGQADTYVPTEDNVLKKYLNDYHVGLMPSTDSEEEEAHLETYLSLKQNQQEDEMHSDTDNLPLYQPTSQIMPAVDDYLFHKRADDLMPGQFLQSEFLTTPATQNKLFQLDDKGIIWDNTTSLGKSNLEVDTRFSLKDPYVHGSAAGISHHSSHVSPRQQTLPHSMSQGVSHSTRGGDVGSQNTVFGQSLALDPTRTKGVSQSIGRGVSHQSMDGGASHGNVGRDISRQGVEGSMGRSVSHQIKAGGVSHQSKHAGVSHQSMALGVSRPTMVGGVSNQTLGGNVYDHKVDRDLCTPDESQRRLPAPHEGSADVSMVEPSSSISIPYPCSQPSTEHSHELELPSEDEMPDIELDAVDGCSMYAPSYIVAAQTLDVSVNPSHQKRRDALFCVFMHLDNSELGNASQVCKEWRDVSRHPALWRIVTLSYGHICSKYLKTISSWCTQLQSLKLEGLLARPRLSPQESPEDYDRKTRGWLESGFEQLLTATSDSLTSLSVLNCGNILTDRCLWLASCHCRALQRIAYVSMTDPVGPEVLWALGAGCRDITSLAVPPMVPNRRPKRFSNRCVQMIGQCWPDLNAVCVGGFAVSQRGLVALAGWCQKLHHLQLDHTIEMTEATASAMCHAGLRHLRSIDLTFTPVQPAALLLFHKHCSMLSSISVHLGISDYFRDANDMASQQQYQSIVDQLLILTHHPTLKHLLKIKADYG